MIKDFLLSKQTRKELNRFIEMHASDKYTLDIGCANSPYSKYFPNRVGFDVVEGPGVTVIGDAHELPFKDNEFELILCTEVLEHLHTPHQAIDEMRRVLAPGGMLILTTRFLFPLHDTPYDYYRYTKYGLQYLLRDWEISELREEVPTRKVFGVLLQRLGLQTQPYGGMPMRVLILLAARLAGAGFLGFHKQYGVTKKGQELEEDQIMTSGYYVVAKKL